MHILADKLQNAEFLNLGDLKMCNSIKKLTIENLI